VIIYSTENQSTGGLQVDSLQTLGLVGGELQFSGGHLTAPQGRIELGSVGANSFVQITPTIKWIINSQGQVELVAHVPEVTPHSSWYKSAICLNE
jgi:hypothetical protein